MSLKMTVTNELGNKLLESARQAVHAASTGDMAGITIREVEIVEPGLYRPADVKALRSPAGSGASKSGSIRTMPVNQSAGPLPEGREPLRLMSMKVLRGSNQQHLAVSM